MSNYWSNSKLADKIRGIKPPESGTQEEWTEWRALAKKKPARYWFAEDGLDHLQSIMTSPIELKNIIRSYIVNRWKNGSNSKSGPKVSFVGQ